MIVFDFDGTIANSTPYHKEGWKNTLTELGIETSIGDILPYEPNLRERFDSYRRLQKGLVDNGELYPKIRAYFKNVAEGKLLHRVMDLKESYIVSAILHEPLSASYARLAKNLLLAVEVLRKKGRHLAVVSSTREAVITAYLYKVNLLDSFEVVIGEESMTDQKGLLHDKPDEYAHTVLQAKTKKRMSIYIGDNDVIDREFANNCQSHFILAKYNTDFLELTEQL